MNISAGHVTNAISQLGRNPEQNLWQNKATLQESFSTSHLEFTKFNIVQNEALDTLLNVLIFIGTLGLAHLSKADYECNNRKERLSDAFFTVARQFATAKPETDGTVKIEVEIDGHTFTVTINTLDGNFSVSDKTTNQQEARGSFGKPLQTLQTHLLGRLKQDTQTLTKATVSTLENHPVAAEKTQGQLLEDTTASIPSNLDTHTQQKLRQNAENALSDWNTLLSYLKHCRDDMDVSDLEKIMNIQATDENDNKTVHLYDTLSKFCEQVKMYFLVHDLYSDTCQLDPLFNKYKDTIKIITKAITDNNLLVPAHNKTALNPAMQPAMV